MKKERKTNKQEKWLCKFRNQSKVCISSQAPIEKGNSWKWWCPVTSGLTNASQRVGCISSTPWTWRQASERVFKYLIYSKRLEINSIVAHHHDSEVLGRVLIPVAHTMPYHYLSTPSQLAVTKCHISWRMSMTDCDFSKNRSLSIHHFFWWRKVEILSKVTLSKNESQVLVM